MAKKRQGKHDEVMLIPFLDILCSLIGVLILIVVVMSVSQMQRVDGRSKEEVARAQRYQTLLQQLKDEEKAALERQAKVAELERKRNSEQRLRMELDEKQRKLAEMRQQLQRSADTAQADKLKTLELRKRIESRAQESLALAQSLKSTQAEILALRKSIDERRKLPEIKPKVQVMRSTGSGTVGNQRLFFVEVNGIAIKVHQEKGKPINVPIDNVKGDKDFNAFLEKVKNTGNASLLFLVRKGGGVTYLRAAGWAEQQYQLNTGKIPIPGEGPLDLSLFAGERY
jgi:hypothetical protein